MSKSSALPDLNAEYFKELGTGKVAYIKELTVDEAKELCTNFAFEKGERIFGVYDANGIPLYIAGNPELAVGYAIQKNREIRARH